MDAPVLREAKVTVNIHHVHFLRDHNPSPNTFTTLSLVSHFMPHGPKICHLSNLWDSCRICHTICHVINMSLANLSF